MDIEAINMILSICYFCSYNQNFHLKLQKQTDFVYALKGQRWLLPGYQR